LLNHLVHDAAFADAAVLVNEFGEVGIDHHLIACATERLVVLAGGCVCCAIREDLVGAIRHLCAQRERGEIPPFSRLVLETTRLADPVPVLATLRTAAPAAASLEVTGTVTRVDGVLGLRTLAEFPQAVKQVVTADTLLITKAELTRPEELEKLQRTVEALNPWAPVEDHRSRLTLIVRHLDGKMLERSLRTFHHLKIEEQGRQAHISAEKLVGAGGTVGGRPIRRPTAPKWIKG
jgi:G3E family GTPase